MDVGVDTHDFRPWPYDEISRLMTARAKARIEQNASPDFATPTDSIGQRIAIPEGVLGLGIVVSSHVELSRRWTAF
jgi:hypothetical protein